MFSLFSNSGLDPSALNRMSSFNGSLVKISFRLVKAKLKSGYMFCQFYYVFILNYIYQAVSVSCCSDGYTDPDPI